MTGTNNRSTARELTGRIAQPALCPGFSLQHNEAKEGKGEKRGNWREISVK